MVVKIILMHRFPRWYLGFVAGFFLFLLLVPELVRLTVPVPAKPRPLYNGNLARAEVALACNVFWGEEYLQAMLDALDRSNVKITFFIGGSWAQRHPDQVREIAARGHEIGNHSYTHPHPNVLNKQQNIDQIRRTEQLVADLTGIRTTLYAPPYGEFNDTVLAAANEAGYRTILWSVDTVDWKRPPAQIILSRVLGKLHNGAIILMHPTEPTVQALPELIFRIQGRGYTLKPVSAILD